jgi:methylated-DNA-[protein]-cysteine S-methyltransferase
MGQAAHHYLIFETAGGFCGIAWNDAGITRFQLPTKSAEARRSCSKILPRSRSLSPRCFRVPILLGPRLRR